VTYDIERQIEGGERLGTSEFAAEVTERVESMA
jgi:isocitrate dehydrogenase